MFGLSSRCKRNSRRRVSGPVLLFGLYCNLPRPLLRYGQWCYGQCWNNPCQASHWTVFISCLSICSLNIFANHCFYTSHRIKLIIPPLAGSLIYSNNWSMSFYSAVSRSCTVIKPRLTYLRFSRLSPLKVVPDRHLSTLRQPSVNTIVNSLDNSLDNSLVTPNQQHIHTLFNNLSTRISCVIHNQLAIDCGLLG